LAVLICISLWSPEQVRAERLASAASAGFSLKDDPGKAMDVYLDGRLVARYMYAHDNSTPERLHETYTLNGRRHSVVQMNHPDNPSGTKFSAYRDYGRFGAFFTQEIKAGETLTVQYRFLIADGEMPATKLIQRHWDRFAGQRTASPVPNTRSVESVPKKAKKQKNAKKK